MFEEVKTYLTKSRQDNLSNRRENYQGHYEGIAQNSTIKRNEMSRNTVHNHSKNICRSISRTNRGNLHIRRIYGRGLCRHLWFVNIKTLQNVEVCYLCRGFS